jgi:cytoskeletal protein CcmA (bactofilin family)
MSPVTSRTPGADSPNTTAIGRAVKIVGEIISKQEDLQIDGEVEGAIEARDCKITIGLSGRIQATILARDIVVVGQVRGDIVASGKVELKKDSKLVGDITSPRIVLDDGAQVKGKIDTVGARMPEPRSVAVASTQPAAPSEVAAGS